MILGGRSAAAFRTLVNKKKLTGICGLNDSGIGCLVKLNWVVCIVSQLARNSAIFLSKW